MFVSGLVVLSNSLEQRERTCGKNRDDEMDGTCSMNDNVKPARTVFVRLYSAETLEAMVNNLLHGAHPFLRG
jgi:hypothetical protein